VLFKVGRLVYRVDRALPILLAIADEFKPNGGNSLRDQVDNLTVGQGEIQDVVAEHSHEDERRFEHLEAAITDQKWK
jgi:hypothetical protein